MKAVALLSLIALVHGSDENITIKESPIDYSYLTPCLSKVGPGVTCLGDTTPDSALCVTGYRWCRSDITTSCVTSKDRWTARTATDDSRLCSNRTFWENIWTDSNNIWVAVQGGVKAGLGVRCTGSKMGIIYPWYKYYTGEPPNPYLKQNCEDQSDRVHIAGQPCPNRTYYLDIHNSEWCSDDSVKALTICTNSSAWLETTAIDQERLDDPHYCQESCATPGLNCVACTGEKYFKCSRSNTCIHPDLECDGQPQCPDNEDEDFERCSQKNK